MNAVSKLSVFIMVYTESENPLTEAGIDINGDQVEIFCSSVTDCLVLTYDCLNSDILHTLYIHFNDTRVLRIAANRLYSLAFFGVITGKHFLDRPLERHPGMVMNGVVVDSEESSAASCSMSIGSVFLFCTGYLS